MSRITPDDIDAILPQTQCGLCGHGGCMPYAEALIFENAEINLCPPGGVPTLKALGELLGIDPVPFIPEMEKKTQAPSTAVIREAECIGCTKCIQACPVDAILGSAKQMHTIIGADCTGCGLCIPPCPVDCIDLLSTTHFPPAAHLRGLHQRKQQRLSQEAAAKKSLKKKDSLLKRKRYIEAALARQTKKNV